MQAASIHRIAEKGSLPGNRATLAYAASCMSIRPELQVAASPSDGSTDLIGSEGKTSEGKCLEAAVVAIPRRTRPCLCRKVNYRQRAFSETQSSQPVPSSALVDDEGRSGRASPGYRPRSRGGGSYGRIVPAVASLGQALLVKLQLRFSIPNAHERTKASFPSIVRSRISATRTKKSTGIWRVLPAIRFSKRRGL